MSLSPGTRLGPYEILSPLGAGGMGEVYRARDHRLDRDVALKILSEKLAGDPSMLARFEREAKAVAALSHPNIVAIHDFSKERDVWYAVTECLEGQTLRDRLERGPLPWKAAVEIAMEIASGLTAAHDRGIVHRDLKPENVFLTRDGRVKILDFGLARPYLLPSSTQAVTSPLLSVPGQVMGTFGYMSPEQIRGEAADARSDIFSFGCVLYELVSGRAPFARNSGPEVLAAVLKDDPLALPVTIDVAEALEELLLRCLAKRPDDRFQTLRDLGYALKQLLRDPSSVGIEKNAAKSIAVLYLENLSGLKEDEYLRDGVTEDIITELLKIRGLNIFSRATVLIYRDKAVTPAAIGQQIHAAYILTGSLRRAGARLRINAQLVDTKTEFPIWSERYDREMKDIFEVQDEIARKIADALRITLTPQEEQALAEKPTVDPKAYDVFLLGKSYARRVNRKAMDVALRMFESAVAIDPNFALAHAAIANVCAQYHHHYDRDPKLLDRAVEAAQQAAALHPNLPEVLVAEGWALHTQARYDAAVEKVRLAIVQNPNTEGAYYLLGRALFSAGRYQEVVAVADEAMEAAGDDYNVYVPINNAMGALGMKEAHRKLSIRRAEVLETHLEHVPEDFRARSLVADDYARLGRFADANRHLETVMSVGPVDGIVLYNVACVFCHLGKREEGMAALRRASEMTTIYPAWVRRDPDLELLHGHPEFERLFPASDAEKRRLDSSVTDSQ